jgi:hypothetical protein
MVVSAGTPLSSSKPAVKAVNCPNCGASLTVRSMERAVSLVCDHCHAILDAKDPNLKILQTFKASTDEDRPLIPLGARGKWRGVIWEVIGFQRRSITVFGVTYSWHEHLLFNPFKGFRYLTEYEGHWNDLSPVSAAPEVAYETSATYLGKTYRHFQTASAVTRFVLGEFPWEVRVGERAEVSDYIDPPYVLSSEKTGNEITWSSGEYVYGRDLWKAFELEGVPPNPVGVYENQPSPLRATTKAIWMTFALLATLLLWMLVFNEIKSQQAKVFEQTYPFDTGSTGEASFVTPVFKLAGRTSNVQFETYAQVQDQWIYVNYALINQDTGKAYDFGREVSYYSGYDSDGHWTEGSQHDSVVVPSVPSGNYYLRIEPESDRGLGIIYYTVTVTRDVPLLLIYLLALIALLLPALLISWRTINFEQMRLAESDHPKESYFKATGGSE